jgi:large subunit ribosomal protein L18
MKDLKKVKNELRLKRKHRIRAKISGQAEKPRLSVYRSLGHIYAQLIDDVAGKTIVFAKDKEIKAKDLKKVEIAAKVGSLLAEKAKKAGITQVVFDRGGYKYHGRVKALADGAREGGLKF